MPSNEAISPSQQPADDFSVTIAASTRIHLSSSSVVNIDEVAAHVIHAVSVTQPLQSWTVIRDHIDFLAMDVALRSTVTMLPVCPGLPPMDHSTSESDVDLNFIVQARSSALEWLSAALRFPAVRSSALMRQFLCYGANVIPPHFEGLRWVNFSTSGVQQVRHTLQHQHHPGPVSYAAAVIGGSSSRSGAITNNLDEMEMEDMFAFENEYQDDHTNVDSLDDDDSYHERDLDEDDDKAYLQGRYEPMKEPLCPSEVMEIQQDYKEVEMVEDVGSLAQSLGASHLGRSLNLQREMMTSRKGMQTVQQHQPLPHGLPPGVNIISRSDDVSSNLPALSPTSGGIGGAVAEASQQEQSHPQVQQHVQGLSDSFYRTAPVSAPRLESFKMVKVIGKGSFGKVFLVKEKQTNEMFALKVLKKDNIIKRNQVEHTKTERSVLGYVKHPFIVGLNMAFQSKDKLYFVLDYCAGGELFFHLGKVGKFSEPRACFYAAEITLAIAYVHSLDIVYRDLKPENVLLDSLGHVRLTDFGLSKEGISNSSSGANSFCGTPEYLAPEILNRQGHGRAVDWWSLGALLFEMLTGLPPFYCRDREKLFEKIRKGTLEYPKHLSLCATQLLKGLLTKDPRRRLGSGPNDAEDIKAQDFFDSLAWEKLMNGEMVPPWRPQINGSTDTSQFDHEFTSMPLHSPKTIQGHGFGTTPADNVFEGFTFTDRSFYAPPSNRT